MSIEWFGQEVRILRGRGRSHEAQDYVLVEICEDGRRHLANVEELEATGGASEIETRIFMAENQRSRTD